MAKKIDINASPASHNPNTTPLSAAKAEKAKAKRGNKDGPRLSLFPTGPAFGSFSPSNLSGLKKVCIAQSCHFLRFAFLE
jgi:hypothetical protein